MEVHFYMSSWQAFLFAICLVYTIVAFLVFVFAMKRVHETWVVVVASLPVIHVLGLFLIVDVLSIPVHYLARRRKFKKVFGIKPGKYTIEGNKNLYDMVILTLFRYGKKVYMRDDGKIVTNTKALREFEEFYYLARKFTGFPLPERYLFCRRIRFNLVDQLQ